MINFEEGIGDLTDWVKKQICEDKVEQALSELEKRGLA